MIGVSLPEMKAQILGRGQRLADVRAAARTQPAQRIALNPHFERAVRPTLTLEAGVAGQRDSAQGQSTAQVQLAASISRRFQVSSARGDDMTMLLTSDHGTTRFKPGNLLDDAGAAQATPSRRA